MGAHYAEQTTAFDNARSWLRGSSLDFEEAGELAALHSALVGIGWAILAVTDEQRRTREAVQASAETTKDSVAKLLDGMTST